MYTSCYRLYLMSKTIDEAKARALAVKAECDPRTIKKVLRGGFVRGMPGHRAKAALVEAGLIEKERAA